MATRSNNVRPPAMEVSTCVAVIGARSDVRGPVLPGPGLDVADGAVVVVVLVVVVLVLVVVVLVVLLVLVVLVLVDVVGPRVCHGL
jgi:hypothetical protein